MPKLLRYGASDFAPSFGGPLFILVVDLYDKLVILRTYSKPDLLKESKKNPNNGVEWEVMMYKYDVSK